MEKIRVLIVDDEAEVGEILCLRLARRGMDVCAVTGAREALVHLRSFPADVVLLDVKMPDIDGIEALGLLLAEWKSLIVIMISGHADMEVAAQGLKLGAFSYLLKPVDIDVLHHKIDDACRLRELNTLAS